MPQQINSVGTTGTEARVDTPSAAYNEMASHWVLIEALMGGTLAMRAARETYLPKETKETEDGYNNRICRSILFPALQDTVTKLSSKPFVRPVQISDLPDRLKPLKDNMDGEGSDVTVFSAELFQAGTQYGLTHVLVDFPRTGEKLTLEEENKLFPVMVHVKPTQLLSWTTSVSESGKKVLERIRYKETRTESVGDWGEEKVEYIRIYTRETVEVWRKTEDATEYSIFQPSVPHSFGKVPLFTVYFDRTDFMEAKPPLEDLAWLNLAHWQSSSDQRNLLRYARVAILFAQNFGDEAAANFQEIGGNKVIHAPGDADLKYVEHSGQALGLGQQDLDKLEMQMTVIGMQPLVDKTGDQTATEVAVDEAKTQSEIQSWVRNLENMLEACYGAAAKWTKTELTDFKVDIFSEFSLPWKDFQEIAALGEWVLKGLISYRTFLKEVKKRGVLGDDVKIDEEEDNFNEHKSLTAFEGGDGEDD